MCCCCFLRDADTQLSLVPGGLSQHGGLSKLGGLGSMHHMHRKQELKHSSIGKNEKIREIGIPNNCCIFILLFIYLIWYIGLDL